MFFERYFCTWMAGWPGWLAGLAGWPAGLAGWLPGWLGWLGCLGWAGWILTFFWKFSNFDQTWDLGPLIYCRNILKGAKTSHFKKYYFANRMISYLEFVGTCLCQDAWSFVIFEISKFRNVGTSKRWNFEIVVFWNVRLLKLWSGELWNFEIPKIGIPKFWERWVPKSYEDPFNYLWKMLNMGSISPREHELKVFAILIKKWRNEEQEAQKRRNKETKKPRNDEIKKPRNHFGIWVVLGFWPHSHIAI